MSYADTSDQDAAIARVLRSKLDAAGVDVLDPVADLPPGANFALAIGRALERADVMVVLLSPDAVRSDGIRREIEYALGNTRFRDRLVPVLVRRTNEMPWILNRLRVIDVTGDD